MSKSLGAPWKFAALCGISLVIAWRPLANTFSLAMGSEEYTHILLILPVVVALVAPDWRAMKAAAKPGLAAGGAVLAIAAVIAVIAWWKPALESDVRLALSMLALVAWWAGAFVLCFGTRIARWSLFPLCFLLWMVPFPLFLLDWIIQLLQRGSALSARLLFVSAGVPVTQDGLLLTVPGVTLEVAKECSSIRSSMLLLVTTMVMAQLFLRSPWRRALVIAVAVPLCVAKNGLRIFTIAMLGTRVDPGYLTGRFHHHGGIVFLVIAMMVIFLLIWLLRLAENHESGPAVASATPV